MKHIRRIQPVHWRRVRARAALVFAAIAAAAAGVMATASPALAASTVCSGFTACQTNPYTDHAWGSHYTSSYWGQVAGHNCTNYVAYYEQTMHAMSASRPLWLTAGHNADDWASEAQAGGITVSAAPVVGAIAQWGDYSWNGNAGHVGIVEEVSNNGATIKVSWDSYPSGPYKWVTLNSGDPNTGTAVGWPNNFIYLGVVASGHSGRDLAWYDGTTLWGFKGPGLGTVAGVTGYGHPDWAGVGDYNHDGHEDIFWYHQTSTTIYAILGPSFQQVVTVRGPGVGPPVWASVGDFDGNGYRDEIAWYDGATLYKFAGPGLGTVFSVGGYATPDWAGVGDYNRDGRDDLFWYHGGGNGTIYVLNSNGTGFDGAYPVRGPGVGVPQWAGVADLDGEGHRNDLAWYSGGVLFSFTGPGLPTTGAVTGYATPDWAGIGDCDNAGRDGVYWYHGGANGTIYCINSNGSSLGSVTTVRGPGIGAPLWAGSGDMF